MSEPFAGAIIDGGSILAPPLPIVGFPNMPGGPFGTPPGLLVGGPAGSGGGNVSGRDLGLAPVSIGPDGEPVLEVDALSYGRDFGEQLYFSVDEWAVGVPGVLPLPNVLSEGLLGNSEASADVFVYTAGIVGGGNLAVADGDGVPPFGAGGAGLALIEPNPPTMAAVPDAGDNLDALDLFTLPEDITGPIYFSLDSAFADPIGDTPNSGTAAANGFVGGDILVNSAPGAAPTLYASASSLGLDTMGADTDDLDALTLVDADGDPLTYDPTAGDMLLFSVRRGSAIIGTLDPSGTPIEEGDVLMDSAVLGLPLGSVPAIFIPAELLGLATVRSGTSVIFNGIDSFGDELDALDRLQPPTIVPEPSTYALLGACLAVTLLRRRRSAT